MCQSDLQHRPTKKPQWKFVDVQDPTAVRDREKVRSARGHAVARALAEKRKKAQNAGLNFRPQTYKVDRTNVGNAEPASCNPKTLTWTRPLSTSSIDPFETLAVDASRLTALFHLKTSLSAGEPVFNINEAIHYSSLTSVFGCGFSDGALTAALCLTLSYAANGWQCNRECITLSSVAMKEMRQKLLDPGAVCTPATIGTTLLLLGISYRLGELQGAIAHLQGLKTMLQLCAQRQTSLSAALKRAIYWQDLFSSIFLNTDRIVCYSDFYPGPPATRNIASSSPLPPPGFATSAHLLGTEFLIIAADVSTLYADRQAWLTCQGLTSLDDVQAEMEGRIHDLRRTTTDNLLLCCLIASQLCVYGFWDGVWNSTLIPRELSMKMLHHLRRCELSDVARDPHLFLWLLCVCKAFAIDASVRCGLEELRLEWQRATGLAPLTWSETDETLAAFIWSDVLYCPARGWFWERIGK